ncbi:hypothetical protein HTSR_0626 [Halodesulfurarchaeum formicicum]|uniref:4Fe-4S ferredoxin iron-sulfur binding domain-containing protein n=1 Tax=Halodesulfurarchaeum formicicum TaxID=1873524 RepID=A0A1D8S394_9EURY|nr:4Fe-4S ferredoxin N-terminal domain-containing protein [Halodesulfurarchaeum formicicum]AOW79819.1 hypothetical protein HTSR_0626 [Halodesulfurarchaeum formicicum]
MHNKGEAHDIYEGDIDERAESILGDVPFDTELGKRLAKDAAKVRNGDLSREKFHEKHHEAVMKEFGRDERHSKPEGFDDE